MKTIKLLIIALLLASCSSDSIDEEEDNCGCVKTVYEYETIVTIGFNGLPTLSFVENTLSTENVPCNDEVEDVDNGNDTLFRIVCN